MTVDAGPFKAHIVRTRIGVTANRRLQTIDFAIGFTNTSAKKLILGYGSTSSFPKVVLASPPAPLLTRLYCAKLRKGFTS